MSQWLYHHRRDGLALLVMPTQRPFWMLQVALRAKDDPDRLRWSTGTFAIGGKLKRQEGVEMRAGPCSKADSTAGREA